VVRLPLRIKRGFPDTRQLIKIGRMLVFDTHFLRLSSRKKQNPDFQGCKACWSNPKMMISGTGIDNDSQLTKIISATNSFA
jgi:hypothetical protein